MMFTFSKPRQSALTFRCASRNSWSRPCLTLNLTTLKAPILSSCKFLVRVQARSPHAPSLRPHFQSLFLPSRRQSPAHFGLGRGVNGTGVPRQARTPAAAYMWLFSTDSDLELLC